MQETQEWIDLIMPWNDIENIWYTSRRINQKMQVRNVYLDSDKARSIDDIPSTQLVELQPVQNFTHTILWNNDFWEAWEDWIYIPADWTYLIKYTLRIAGSISWWVTAVILRNASIDNYSESDIVIELDWMWNWTIPTRFLMDTVCVDLSKWDMLNVWVGLGSNSATLTCVSDISVIKLS